MTSPVTYFKRYRMEVDLTQPLPGPRLPAGFSWVAWDESLLETHAEVKLQCFAGEMDAIVFPNLGCRDGCLRLMRDITSRAGFVPGATWLIANGNEYCGTVQGASDRRGTGAIQNLGITPAYRGRGLGTALLLQALHGFRRAGLAVGMLEVTARNESAVRLYRRYGFRFKKTLYKAVEPVPTALPLEPLTQHNEWCV